MGIFAWIILGAVAGALARVLFPPRNPRAWLATLLVAIAGGIIGGWIAARIWGSGLVGDYRSLVGAVVGAVVLLWVYHRVLRAPGESDINDRRAA